MFDLRVKGGALVMADALVKADLWIKDGIIAAVTANRQEEPAAGEMTAAEVVDARNKLVFPGLIDCHAHFQVPGYTYRETFETGSRAAAVSGVTTVIDMPLNNEPPTISPEAFQLKLDMIQGQAYTDYALWGGYVGNNLDQLPAMQKMGAAAFKSFLSPVKEGDFVSVNLWQAREGMQLLKETGGMLGLHCEDPTLLAEGRKKAEAEGRTGIEDFLAVHSVTAEKIAVMNAIELCRETGCRIHICHVSHPDAAQLIRTAQQEGLPVTAETCPHYLGFTFDKLYEKGSLAKCTPPLRSAEARDRLWDYLIDGTLSCVGTDHSPAAPEEKDDVNRNIWQNWGGLNAIQYFLPYLYHLVVNVKGLSPALVTQVAAENPARVFGLNHRKGSLKVGMDADLVILDPKRPWKAAAETLYTLHPISVFEGEAGTGFPELTLLRGRVTARDGKYVETAKGHGDFVSSDR